MTMRNYVKTSLLALAITTSLSAVTVAANATDAASSASMTLAQLHDRVPAQPGAGPERVRATASTPDRVPARPGAGPDRVRSTAGTPDRVPARPGAGPDRVPATAGAPDRVPARPGAAPVRDHRPPVARPRTQGTRVVRGRNGPVYVTPGRRADRPVVRVPHAQDRGSNRIPTRVRVGGRGR
jgi:hypothetical protein